MLLLTHAHERLNSTQTVPFWMKWGMREEAVSFLFVFCPQSFGLITYILHTMMEGYYIFEKPQFKS